MMDPEELDFHWQEVLDFVRNRFKKEADIKEVLFLIGLREYGHIKKKFTKEEKQDLMNLAVCKIFSFDGYFRVSHLDADGWPVWKQSKPMPQLSVREQEDFIREHIVRYFEHERMI